jgi:hypothetical protein
MSALALSFMASCLAIIANTPPVNGYELSIYQAYPPYFWALIAASIACGIGILVHQAFLKEGSRWWVAGLLIIIFSNSIFLYLPSLRGYAIYGRGDTLTHIGFIKDILLTGHISKSNFYPVVHILGANLIEFTGISPGSMVNLLFVFFSALYIVNVYVLAKVIAKNHGQALLVTAFASPLIFSLFHVNIHPSFLSLFMVPLLLYFYHRASASSLNRVWNLLLLGLLTLTLAFFHPVTALYTIIALLTFVIAQTVYRRYVAGTSSRLVPQISKNNTRVAVVTCLVLLALFCGWYFTNDTIPRNLAKVYERISPIITTDSSEVQPAAEETAYMSISQQHYYRLTGTGLNLSRIMVLFFIRYGAIFLYLIIASILSILVLGKSLFRKTAPQPMSFTYSLQFMVALAISIFMLFAYAIEINEIRMVRFTLLMGTIVTGLVSYDAITIKKSGSSLMLTQKSGGIIVFLLIMATVVLSLGCVYSRPQVYRPQQQVSWMEIYGTEWFGRKANFNITTSAIYPLSIRRFSQCNFGKDFPSTPQDRKAAKNLPPHFGYTKYEYIAEALDSQGSYIVIFERDKLFHLMYPENVRQEVYQYTEDDFFKLDSDHSAAKIYMNGGVEVWRVYGRGEKTE